MHLPKETFPLKPPGHFSSTGGKRNSTKIYEFVLKWSVSVPLINKSSFALIFP